MPTPSIAREAREEKRRARRAFIAAPLLGSIIFLACILFIVNLNKAEAAETSRIVGDAYHNRIVSLLEVYRTDLGTLFRSGLSYTIETLLTKQNWANLFRVSNSISSYYQQEDCDPQHLDGSACATYDKSQADPKRIDLKESRYQACQHINTIIHEIICSIPPSQGDTCEGSCGGTGYSCTNPKANDASCAQCCKAATDQGYGLPKWMGYLNQPITFEGIQFAPANYDQFKIFLNPSTPEEWADYGTKCRELLNGSIFDCDYFAQDLPADNTKEVDKKPFQCVDHAHENNDPNKPEIGKIDGCEAGVFFVKVAINNSDIYPIMPRIIADDGVGNQIRSGSIGEEDFYLPINYPLFQYYQYAFAFYKQIAYGSTEGPHQQQVDEGQSEGIADGHCLGGDNCKQIEIVQGDEVFGDTGYGGPAATPDDASGKASPNFFKVFQDACKQTVSKQFGGDITDPSISVSHEMCLSSKRNDCGVLGVDSNQAGWKNCTELTSVADDPETFGADAKACPDATDKYCGYYNSKQFNMRLLDYNPAYQIDPDYPNAFAWWAWPYHDDCAGWNQFNGKCES